MQDESKSDQPAEAVTPEVEAQPPTPEAEGQDVQEGAELTLEGLKGALEEAQARANENWEKFLRAGAEQENIRKRSVRDIDNARKFALERFATDLLGVIDSLHLGLKSAQEAGAGQEFLDGMELTLRLLREALDKHGVEEVDPKGQAFDPNLHEAMATVPTADQEPNTVVDVMQRGYTLNGRLLRPAMVIVAKAPDAA